MRKILLILIALSLAACSPSSNETPIASPEIVMVSPESVALSCETVVETSLQSLETECSQVGRNEVCYGNRLIDVQLREGADNAFDAPGDRIPLETIESLSLSPMNEANGEWGFALMQVQADLPDTLPGQNVTFLLFGGTEIRPEGEIDGLQAFYVRTGMGATSACNAVPDDGLIIQSPEGDVTVAFSLNGVRFELGSTAYITANETMRVQLLEGQAVVSAAGESQTVSAGEESSVPLDSAGQASGAPTLPESYETSHLFRLPLTILPRPIEAAPALDSRPTATETIDLSENPIPEFATADNPELGIVSGEIAAVNETDIYTFESRGEQAIYLDAQAMEGDIRVNLISPSEELLINIHWLGTDYGTILLEEAGVYTLEIKGHNESTGTYQLQFWNVPAPNRMTATLTAAIPDNREGLISGELRSPAAKDIYEFSAEAGQNIFVDAQSMEGDIRVSIISPSETILLNQHWLGTDALPISLTETGTYRLEAYGYLDSGGTYELLLWEIPSPEERTTSIAEAVPNSQEAINTGELLTPASRHIYEFTGTAGQTIYLDAQAMEGDIRASLSSPDGTVLLDQHWLGTDPAPFVLSETGSYSLAIFGYYDSVGSYQFQIWDVPAPESSRLSISDNAEDPDAIVTGELLTPAVRHIYEFSGEVGQTIFIDSGEMEGDIRANLTSPDGTLLLNQHWLGIDPDSITLSEAGIYTLEFFGYQDSVGSYQFQIWDVPEPETSEISIAANEESREGRMTGSILTPAMSRLYTFDARAGQVIYLAYISQDGDIRASIISPNGEILLDSYWMGVDTAPISLPTSGSYTIRIRGNLDAVGSYEFQLRMGN